MGYASEQRAADMETAIRQHIKEVPMNINIPNETSASEFQQDESLFPDTVRFIAATWKKMFAAFIASACVFVFTALSLFSNEKAIYQISMRNTGSIEAVQWLTNPTAWRNNVAPGTLARTSKPTDYSAVNMDMIYKNFTANLQSQLQRASAGEGISGKLTANPRRPFDLVTLTSTEPAYSFDETFGLIAEAAAEQTNTQIRQIIASEVPNTVRLLEAQKAALTSTNTVYNEERRAEVDAINAQLQLIEATNVEAIEIQPYYLMGSSYTQSKPLKLVAMALVAALMVTLAMFAALFLFGLVRTEWNKVLKTVNS